jgi:hypothetical protein
LNVQGIVHLFRFFKGFPSMPKGKIVGMFTDRGRVCLLSLMARSEINTMMMNKRKWQDQQRSDDGMARSEE